jgi:2-iminobutanoate/2-iminopropanoate deaminase
VQIRVQNASLCVLRVFVVVFGCGLKLRCVAVVLEERIPMSKIIQHKPVQAEGLPKPVGPYSPAVIYEGLVFVSGQGAVDPKTGELAAADVDSQTEQVLKNIASILEAAGSSLNHVLRCGVFLTDISEFPRMNAVYARMFGENRPARTTVQVPALPRAGLRVEIDAVAYIPGRGARRLGAAAGADAK